MRQNFFNHGSMEGSGGRMAKFLLIICIMIGFSWLYAVQLVNPESPVSRFIQEKFLGKKLEPLVSDSDDLTNVSETIVPPKITYTHTPSDEYREYFQRTDRPLPATAKSTPPTPKKEIISQPTAVMTSSVSSNPESDNPVLVAKTNVPNKPGTLSIRPGSRMLDRLLSAGDQGVEVLRFSVLANNQPALLSEIYLENDLDNDEQVDQTQFEASYSFGLYTDSGKLLGTAQMPGNGAIVFLLGQPLQIPAESMVDLVVKVDVLPITKIDNRLKQIRLSIDRNAGTSGLLAHEALSQKIITVVAGDATGGMFLNTKSLLQFDHHQIPVDSDEVVARFSVKNGGDEAFLRKFSFELSSSAGSFSGSDTPSERDLEVYQTSSATFSQSAKSLAVIDRQRSGQYAINFVQPVLRFEPYQTKYFEIRYTGKLSNKNSFESTILTDTKLYTGDATKTRSNIVWSDVAPRDTYYLSGYLLGE